MKLNQNFSLLIILNQLKFIIPQDLFPTTLQNEKGEVYQFTNWGVIRKGTEAEIKYRYLGYNSPYEDIPEIAKTIILSTSCIKLELLISNLSLNMPKEITICNFKSKWDIMLLGFHFIEMIKRKEYVNKKGWLHVLEIANGSSNKFFTTVFATNNGDLSTLENGFVTRHHPVSYILYLGLDGISFSGIYALLPEFFRQKFCFKQIINITVNEYDQSKIRILFRVNGREGVFLLPPELFDNDKLYFINFLKTIPGYYGNVQYQFIPRLVQPNVNLGLFAKERPLTHAEVAAGLKLKRKVFK
jgi:hypothetical protein